jgi:hypothetical protein
LTTLLSRIPHQIPFKATSAVRIVDDENAEGLFLCSASDELAAGLSLEVMVIEAMAQTAGALAFRDSAEPGFLSAIDATRFERPVECGDRLDLKVRLVAAFGKIFRFEGVALRDSEEIVRARFVLASQ